MLVSCVLCCIARVRVRTCLRGTEYSHGIAFPRMSKEKKMDVGNKKEKEVLAEAELCPHNGCRVP